MFDGYIRDHAFWAPRAPAVVTPGRIVAYRQLDTDVDRFGTGLAAQGLGPGSGVASLRVADPYLHRVALLALARLGVASSPADDEAADLKLVLGFDEQGSGVLRLTDAWAAGVLATAVQPLPRRAPDPDALVRVMLSSGTTAQPHRIGFTWQRLEVTTLTNIRVYGAGRLGTWVPLTGPDSLLGFSMGVAAWALGAAYAAGVFIEDLVAAMERDPAGIIVMTPIQLSGLLSVLPPGFVAKPGWRLQVGGSALPAALAREAALRITPDIWTGYGATESSRIAAGPVAALQNVPGAVGVVPASARVEIVDEAGRPLPDGQSGELVVRSTRTAPGYLGDPASTAERFRDGWYATRDLARRLPDGRIVIEGRLDDRMNLGGQKFMPAVLESAAFACPGVRDAAAFAVPGPDGHDVCWLAVVADHGFDRAGLAPHLAAYDGLPPPRFAWVDEIPRNAMGKVERTKLRNALIAATRGDR